MSDLNTRKIPLDSQKFIIKSFILCLVDKTTLLYKTFSKLHSKAPTFLVISLNRFRIDFFTKFPIFPFIAFASPFQIFFHEHDVNQFQSCFHDVIAFRVDHLFPSIRNDALPSLPFSQDFFRSRRVRSFFIRPFLSPRGQEFLGKPSGQMRFRPAGERRDRCKAFYCGGRPRLSNFRATPAPSREITVKERPELERGRKPLVEEDFPLLWVVERSKKRVRATPGTPSSGFGSWGSRWHTFRRSGSWKRQSREQLRRVLYFLRGVRRYFQLDFCSAREGMCIYYGYSISWIYEVFRSWEIFMEIFRCTTHFKILER